MSLPVLDNHLWFPPVEAANEDGLLAMGGDVGVERLLLAYRQGIFPWYEGEVPLWWSPDPRFVLFPEQLRISKSMQGIINKKVFDFTTNKAFSDVILNCKELQRKGQSGTWITDELKDAFLQLHTLGYAQSAEAWENGELVGGLYGIRMQNLFFGESMFAKTSNASKFAFIRYVQQLQTEGVELIDCQVYTSHLGSLGAKMIPRKDFLQYLNQLK